MDGTARPARNIAITLEYDGLSFHGWQSQANASAVQDIIEGAVGRLEGAPVRIAGASRTDAGVHARGQVATFKTSSRIPADKYAYALNAILPAGVTCTFSWEAHPDFHARFSAKSKIYSYTILNRRQPSALYGGRSWHVPLPLRLDAMRDTAQLLIGKHDFRAFMSSGSPVNSTVRTITRLDVDMPEAGSPGLFPVCTQSNEFIRLLVEGDGFLYNMVRIIAGTLVYVGHGRLDAGDVERALATGDRKAAGKTAPPYGLCLEKVIYG